MKIAEVTAAFVAVSVLAGCASEIMRGYVGQDITEVILDRGPPVAVFEMPDGRIAFQWQTTTGMVMPGYTSYSGYNYGNYVSGTAFTSGGSVYNYTCTYTFFGAPNSQGSHTIIGFEPPDPMCE